ncbi:MAG: AAA family ATPase [Bacteroidota bacterium]|nr:AAA family ATPase [Bacteroidota bacterium]
MNTELPELVATIKKIKLGKQFQKYIDFIRFPYYRNLEIDTKINFDFPLTVFIGQNGCGKSSCLHALYGAPKSRTPFDFWFDTNVDPIAYYNDEKKRHSFWYSFKGEKNVIREVIKARIKRGDDPNYWETSRPLTWAGMKMRNDGKRDKPIAKNVVYIDFRAELSAFDKFFYFGNVKGISSKNKQEFIRRKSVQLNNVLSGKVKQYDTSTNVVNKKLRKITTKELGAISFIIGKNYTSGNFLEHSFFRNDGYSVVFNTSHAKYSEAFAGSGEVAVVRLVMRVMDAPDYSLILLDEPEVSLHPGAQNRLKLFLLDQIKQKKHQVVLTSHSPSIVKGLPKEAIKVFYQNPNNGRFIVKENLTPEEAFYHIEYPINERKNIIVEDILAQEIIAGVLDKMGKETKNLFTIKFNPGGESVVKKEFITVFCRESNSKDFVFFDGDQKVIFPHYDWRSFPTSSLNLKTLTEKIKEQTKGETIEFSVDGGAQGGNEKQKIDLLKKYLDYYSSNVFYIPSLLPEDLIWDPIYAHNQIKLTIHDSEVSSKYISDLGINEPIKKKFVFISEILFGSSEADKVLSTQRLFIRNWLNSENADYLYIKSLIESIISNA